MWSSLFDEKQEKLLLPILTLVVTLLAALWKLGRSKGLPPGPRGLPLVGYLPFLGRDLHREFEKLSRIYGPIYKLWLGNKLCVVVSCSELVKEVVRDKDVIFANRDLTVSTSIASYGGNDIAFGSYGPQWTKLRKVFVREMLSNSILDNLYGLRREEVHKSLRQTYQTSNVPIDVGNLSFETAIGAVMNMLFGATLCEERAFDTAKFRAAVAELMVLLGRPNVSDLFPILARFDLQGIERDTKNVIATADHILEHVIEHRRKMKAQSSDSVLCQNMRKDFLEFLLELHDEASSITMDQFKAILQDTMIGATDTTTTMVEWTMAELLKNPEVMRKVQQELTNVVGLNNLVEESHISKMTYLNAVIKETHRLHTALPLLVPRRPNVTTTIGGYKVPKNAQVFLNVGSIHRDPKIWEDPLKFRPERFLDINKFDYSGNNFHFLPFGSGRRMCAGIPLAERVLSYVLASFLHSFEWKFPKPLAELDMSDKFGIVVKKLEPLVAIPTPRLANLELYT